MLKAAPGRHVVLGLTKHAFPTDALTSPVTGDAPNTDLIPTLRASKSSFWVVAGFVNGGGNICDPTTSPFCSGAPARPLDFPPVTEIDTHYSWADQHRHDDKVCALASQRSRKHFLTSSCLRVVTIKLLTLRTSS
jgi:hypothetical protein